VALAATVLAATVLAATTPSASTASPNPRWISVYFWRRGRQK